jgi:hypothetical protein
VSDRVYVKPFVGYVKYASNVDRVYSVGAPGGREKQAVYGVTVEIQFKK